jgi:hypothetical protein
MFFRYFYRDVCRIPEQKVLGLAVRRTLAGKENGVAGLERSRMSGLPDGLPQTKPLSRCICGSKSQGLRQRSGGGGMYVRCLHCGREVKPR